MARTAAGVNTVWAEVISQPSAPIRNRTVPRRHPPGCRCALTRGWHALAAAEGTAHACPLPTAWSREYAAVRAVLYRGYGCSGRRAGGRTSERTRHRTAAGCAVSRALPRGTRTASGHPTVVHAERIG